MSNRIDTKLVIEDDSGDELEIHHTPGSVTPFRATISGTVVYIDSGDADALYEFLSDHT